jgi:hypothetical protein
MAIVDSKEKMLGVNELIQEAYENEEEHRLPLELEYPRFVQEAMMPNSYFLRYGNSIFVLHGDDKQAGIASMRILRADTDENFVQALYQCFKDAYEIGYYLLVVRENLTDSLVNYLDIIENDPKNPDIEYSIDEDSDGDDVVGIVIGNPNNIELKQPIPYDFEPPKNAQEAMALMMRQSGKPPQPMGGDQMPPMQPPMSAPPMGGLGQLKNNLAEGEV